MFCFECTPGDTKKRTLSVRPACDLSAQFSLCLLRISVDGRTVFYTSHNLLFIVRLSTQSGRARHRGLPAGVREWCSVASAMPRCWAMQSNSPAASTTRSTQPTLHNTSPHKERAHVLRPSSVSRSPAFPDSYLSAGAGVQVIHPSNISTQRRTNEQHNIKAALSSSAAGAIASKSNTGDGWIAHYIATRECASRIRGSRESRKICSRCLGPLAVRTTRVLVLVLKAGQDFLEFR